MGKSPSTNVSAFLEDDTLYEAHDMPRVTITAKTDGTLRGSHRSVWVISIWACTSCLQWLVSSYDGARRLDKTQARDRRSRRAENAVTRSTLYSGSWINT